MSTNQLIVHLKYTMNRFTVEAARRRTIGANGSENYSALTQSDDDDGGKNDKKRTNTLGFCFAVVWLCLLALIGALIVVGIQRRILQRVVEREMADADAEMALRVANDTAINMTLLNETNSRISGDQALSDRLDNVLDVSLGKIRTINGVRSNTTTMDIELLVDGPGGLSISNDDMTRSITLTDNGISDISIAPNSGLSATKDASNVVDLDIAAVLSVEGQAPNPTSKNIDMTGTGGIAVTTMGAASNEVIVDGSVLETAVNNLNMENQQQSMRLDNQEDADEDLQMQIDALRQAGEMLQAAFNGTTITFNMSLIDLMSTVYMLKDQVASLQDQLNDAQMDIVQVGTIVPYGGEMAPNGYLKCDGSVYPITNYSDLYSVIGDTYCISCAMDEFAVPDMRGRVAVGTASGNAFFGTTGQRSGNETVTLTEQQMPSHSHSTGSAGSHNHGGNTNTAGTHGHTGTTDSGGSANVLTGNNDIGRLDMIMDNGFSNDGSLDNDWVAIDPHPNIPIANSYGLCVNEQNAVDCNSKPQRNMRTPRLFAFDEFSGSGYLRFNDVTNHNQIPSANKGRHQHGVTVPSHTHDFTTGNAGSHTHSFTTSNAGAHTHTITSTGGGEAHDNVQPSLTVGLYAIKY